MCGPLDRESLKLIWERAKTHIKGYHIHIYMNDAPHSKQRIEDLVQDLKTLFPDHVKGVYNVKIVGPHAKPNIEVDITREGHAEIVEWLQARVGPSDSILVHPETGDDLKDHLVSALWIGRETPFNMAFFERLQARKNANIANRRP